MLFRKITIEDLPFILEIRNDDKTRLFLENSKIFSLEESECWFIETKPFWFIIEQDGNDVGYIRTSEKQNNSIWIGMDIHPKFRRKGIAWNSYIKLIQMLKEDYGIDDFYLEVFSYNFPALSLYKKLGFLEISNRLIDGKSCIKMHLKYNDFKY